ALVAETSFVSFGILGVISAILALAGVIMAWSVAPLAGLGAILLAGFGVFASIRLGSTLLSDSPLAAHDEIKDDAGYHHTTTNLGIAPGSLGVLVTPASPTGRARFIH